LADSATTLREMIGDFDSLDDIDEEALLDTFDIEPEGCIVDVPIPAFIPPAYIDDGVLRLDILRRIARLNADEIDEFKAELEDRFGAIPREVVNLLSVISIKSKAQSIGVTSVEYLRARKLFRFNFGDCRPSWAMKVTLLDDNAGLKDGSQIEYTLPLDDDTPDRLVSFLDRLTRLKTAPA
jgi:transcription-repair coupling factor (superfamily II helicase)